MPFNSSGEKEQTNSMPSSPSDRPFLQHLLCHFENEGTEPLFGGPRKMASPFFNDDVSSEERRKAPAVITLCNNIPLLPSRLARKVYLAFLRTRQETVDELISSIKNRGEKRRMCSRRQEGDRREYTCCIQGRRPSPPRGHTTVCVCPPCPRGPSPSLPFPLLPFLIALHSCTRFPSSSARNLSLLSPSASFIAPTRFSAESPFDGEAVGKADKVADGPWRERRPPTSRRRGRAKQQSAFSAGETSLEGRKGGKKGRKQVSHSRRGRERVGGSPSRAITAVLGGPRRAPPEALLARGSARTSPPPSLPETGVLARECSSAFGHRIIAASAPGEQRERTTIAPPDRDKKDYLPISLV